MTELTRPVRRSVVTHRLERLVVELHPEGIYLREPRRRTKYLLPYGVAFQRAAALFVAAEKARKVAERKARRRKS